MTIVGIDFDGILFVPEVLMAANVMGPVWLFCGHYLRRVRQELAQWLLEL